MSKPEVFIMKTQLKLIWNVKIMSQLLKLISAKIFDTLNKAQSGVIMIPLEKIVNLFTEERKRIEDEKWGEGKKWGGRKKWGEGKKWRDDAEKWRDEEEGNKKRVIDEEERRKFESVSRTIRARRRRNGIFSKSRISHRDTRILTLMFSIHRSVECEPTFTQSLAPYFLLLFLSLTHSLSLSCILIPCSLSSCSIPLSPLPESPAFTLSHQ